MKDDRCPCGPCKDRRALTAFVLDREVTDLDALHRVVTGFIYERGNIGWFANAVKRERRKREEAALEEVPRGGGEA